MRVLIIALIALLTGCSTPAPRIVTKTVTVEVPIVAKCEVPIPERPAYELDRVSVKDDLYVKGRAALIEIEQRKAYEERLRSAAEACR